MNERSPSVTVRIKLVDLNCGGSPSHKPSPRSSSAPVSALVGASKDRALQLQPIGIERALAAEQSLGEICLRTGQAVQHADFEQHIEECVVCGNRVELQLDFIETLELAMYQRRSEPESQKVRGALLISAPKLNFAVCGEIDI
jgi:hypothetical protein